MSTPNTRAQLRIVGVLFLILSIIVVTLRIWVRVRIKKSAGWDDWIMLATVVRYSP